MDGDRAIEDGMFAYTEPPTLRMSLMFPCTLSRRLRRLRRPRRGDTALLPRLLLGLPHATHTPWLPGRRALAPEVLHLGGEYRQPRDPREPPRRCGQACGGQQGLLLHQGKTILLQQQLQETHHTRRRGRAHEDRLLPELLGRHLRPLSTTLSHRELQERLPADVDGEILCLHGLEEVRTVWENSRESSGLQSHRVSIKMLK